MAFFHVGCQTAPASCPSMFRVNGDHVDRDHIDLEPFLNRLLDQRLVGIDGNLKRKFVQIGQGSLSSP